MNSILNQICYYSTGTKSSLVLFYFIAIRFDLFFSHMEQSRQPKDIYFIADEPFVSFVATNYPNPGGPRSICVWQKEQPTKPFTSADRCCSAPFGVCAHTLCCCFFARRKQRHTKLTGLGGGCLFLLAVDG